jgi:quinol monooxygenase YgiN
MIRYDLFEDANEAHTYIVVEKYANMEALKKRMQTEHFKTAAAAFKSLLSSPSQVRILKPSL